MMSGCCDVSVYRRGSVFCQRMPPRSDTAVRRETPRAHAPAAIPGYHPKPVPRSRGFRPSMCLDRFTETPGAPAGRTPGSGTFSFQPQHIEVLNPPSTRHWSCSPTQGFSLRRFREQARSGTVRM